MLAEYFNMYKMLFQVRSAVAYLWDKGEQSAELIDRLYNEDEKFQRKVRFIQRSVFNLFSDTDKDWVVLTCEPAAQGSSNDVNEEVSDHQPETSAKQSSYKRVAHLIPRSTETIEKILIMNARFEICTNKKFYDKLGKIKKKIKGNVKKLVKSKTSKLNVALVKQIVAEEEVEAQAAEAVQAERGENED